MQSAPFVAKGIPRRDARSPGIGPETQDGPQVGGPDHIPSAVAENVSIRPMFPNPAHLFHYIPAYVAVPTYAQPAGRKISAARFRFFSFSFNRLVVTVDNLSALQRPEPAAKWRQTATGEQSGHRHQRQSRYPWNGMLEIR
jgi:hypothetical protein